MVVVGSYLVLFLFSQLIGLGDEIEMSIKTGVLQNISFYLWIYHMYGFVLDFYMKELHFWR